LSIGRKTLFSIKRICKFKLKGSDSQNIRKTEGPMMHELKSSKSAIKNED